MKELLEHIDLEAAQELSWGENVDAENGSTVYEFVHDELDGTRRWDVDHTITFRHKGDLYGFDYAQPATEYQEAGIEDQFPGYSYSDKNVKVYPMRETTVTRYERSAHP